MFYFITKNLRDGDILHGAGQSFVDRAIKSILNDGSHDALVDATNQRVGDATWPRCKWTSFADYEDQMNALKNPYTVEIYRIPDLPPADGWGMVCWWKKHVCGQPYDISIYAKILAKRYAPWLSSLAFNPEWAHWCTESVRDAACAYGHDVWLKDWPTPRTTWNRMKAGKLLDVTASCIGSTP